MSGVEAALGLDIDVKKHLTALIATLNVNWGFEYLDDEGTDWRAIATVLMIV